MTEPLPPVPALSPHAGVTVHRGGPLVFVSPHLDDAVFSCGTLIAAASGSVRVLIVTVCAGIPPADLPTTQLDAAAGFASSTEAVIARRVEDECAAGRLGAEVVHLDVLDGQYDGGDPTDRPMRIRAALEPILGLQATILAPVGVRHADHRDVALACRQRAAWRYEDLPHRVLAPETVAHLPAPDLRLPSSPEKAHAILCYRSQLGDGPAGPELLEEERYHRT